MSAEQVVPEAVTEAEAPEVEVEVVESRVVTDVEELLTLDDWMVEYFLEGEQLEQANEFGFYSEVKGRVQWQWHMDNWNFADPVDPDELIKAKALDAKRKFVTGANKSQCSVLAQNLDDYGIEPTSAGQVTPQFDAIFWSHPDMQEAKAACALLGLSFRSIWQGSGTNLMTVAFKKLKVGGNRSGRGSAPKSGLSGKMRAWRESMM